MPHFPGGAPATPRTEGHLALLNQSHTTQPANATHVTWVGRRSPLETTIFVS